MNADAPPERTPKTYSAAVIGTGRGYAPDASHSVGYLHAEAYRAMGCPITGACARSAEHAKEFGRRYRVEHVGCDYRAVLAAARPEIVSVTTFADSHRDVVEAAVACGAVGVWCEKPLSLSIDDARDVAELCRESGVKMVVNHQRRHLDVFRTVRRLLEQGVVGEPVLLATIGTNWDLVEWGSHWLDMFRYLLGDPRGHWVTGQVRRSRLRQRYEHPVESHGIAYGAFATGARFLLEGGEPPQGTDEAIRIVGTEGLVEVHPDGRSWVYDADGKRAITTASDLSWPHDRTPGSDPYTTTLRGLLEWLDGGQKPDLDVDNAVASTELVLGAYESAIRGDRVDLPLQARAGSPLDVLAAQNGSADV